MKSVADQTVRVDHILVADGHAAAFVDDWSVRHIRLDTEHADFGNTPRAIGCMLGISEGYRGIALLDADNWFEPDHIESCLSAAAKEPCAYVATLRNFYRIDGSPMLIDDESVETHVDTSCFFFLEDSYALLPLWGTMPKPLAPVCDRVFYSILKGRGGSMAQTGRATVNFQVHYDNFYRRLGETPPPGAREAINFRVIQDWIDSLDGVALRKASLMAGTNLTRSTGARATA
jgi:hypothetical protein